MEARSKKLGTPLAFASLGVAVATVVAWFWHINRVAIPENRIVFIACFLVAFGLAIAGLVLRARWFAVVPALIAIVIGGFFPFSMAISRQEVATTGIQVGQTIPHFEALDRNGERFDSASLQGKPVIMKFFRGHW